MAGKEGAAKRSHSLRNPSHCHTVCLQVPLSLSHLFSVSFCRSISLSPSLQKVVLCRWFAHLHFYHSSRCKPNQMVSWDCLKHHSYKLPTVGNYQHRLLFLRKKKKLCFSTCQNPAEGILPSQMHEYCSKKAPQCQQCLLLTIVHCDSIKRLLWGKGNCYISYSGVSTSMLSYRFRNLLLWEKKNLCL